MKLLVWIVQAVILKWGACEKLGFIMLYQLYIAIGKRVNPSTTYRVMKPYNTFIEMVTYVQVAHQ